MNRLSSCLLAAAAVLTVAAATSAAAVARGPAARWQSLAGPTNVGREVGLARTPDGTLHALWSRNAGGGTPTTIYDTRYTPLGIAQGTATVATGWDGAGGLSALAMPDGTLTLFATGGHALGLPPALVGVNTLTRSASGAWTLMPSALWGGAAAGASAYVGSTLTKDGQPVTAWAAAGVGNVKAGLDAGDATQVCTCFATTASVATDAGSGAVVIGGTTIGTPSGAYVQQALPSIGPRQVFAASTQDGAAGLTGRIGAPGVFIAYTDGKATVKLSRYQGGTETVARGAFTNAKAFASSDGRVWIDWGDDHGLYVTRSNSAVTRFEPVQRLGVPAGTSTLWNTFADGSLGPLDLFADVSTGASARGFWHVHVQAKDTLAARVAETVIGSGKNRRTVAKVTFSLTDAGDPVSGATIVVRRGASKIGAMKTDSGGRASIAVTKLPAKLQATANAAGYAATTVGVTAK